MIQEGDYGVKYNNFLKSKFYFVANFELYKRIHFQIIHAKQAKVPLRGGGEENGGNQFV